MAQRKEHLAEIVRQWEHIVSYRVEMMASAVEAGTRGAIGRRAILDLSVDLAESRIALCEAKLACCEESP